MAAGMTLGSSDPDPTRRMLRATMHERLLTYIRKESRRIDGWLVPESAAVIAHLAMAQIDWCIGGGAGEIGVHHGKLFLLLCLALQEGEKAFALDLFGNQQLNRDASGAGDSAIFLGHLHRICGNAERVSIFAQDSTVVSAEVLLAATGPLRLMSVDGGHTEEVTSNDLQLGETLLRPEGILILDDLYQERWPAVAAGTFRFMNNPANRLRPFAISPNKTYFCKDPPSAARYRDLLAREFAELILARASIFGSEVLILGHRTLSNRIRNHPLVRDNPNLYHCLSRLRHFWR
jgi:hypothetical protein